MNCNKEALQASQSGISEEDKKFDEFKLQMSLIFYFLASFKAKIQFIFTQMVRWRNVETLQVLKLTLIVLLFFFFVYEIK